MLLKRLRKQREEVPEFHRLIKDADRRSRCIKNNDTREVYLHGVIVMGMCYIRIFPADGSSTYGISSTVLRLIKQVIRLRPDLLLNRGLHNADGGGQTQ